MHSEYGVIADGAMAIPSWPVLLVALVIVTPLYVWLVRR